MGILAIVIWGILNLSGVIRPSYLILIVDKAIKVTAWIALLPIGVSIELLKVKNNLRDMPSIFLVKFIILFLIAVAIAIPLLSDKIAIITVIMLAMTPVAINAVVVTKMNNLDEELTINAFLITSTFFHSSYSTCNTIYAQLYKFLISLLVHQKDQVYNKIILWRIIYYA